MRGHDLFRYAAIVACVLCYTTILLGGNVMASDSGLACPDWPSCYGNGNFLPALQGGVALEWSHRVSAFFLATSILILAMLGIAYERQRRVLLRISLVCLGLVITEALLGGLVVESQLVPDLVLTHLAIATILFGILLVLVLLSNLRELPRRWVDWARRATDEVPAPTSATPPYYEEPHRVPGSPFDLPRQG
ncbi:MAG TPA: COX15/CtaA family protein [Thermoplasmata archaeon]|nr:COX15/CtaA family protein [Thermoplasmata archaeon]HYB77588.1 COX15/CtaA family protein [Thermoplasmata archaeon]